MNAKQITRTWPAAIVLAALLTSGSPLLMAHSEQPMPHSDHQMNHGDHQMGDADGTDHTAHQRMISRKVGDAQRVNLTLENSALLNRQGAPLTFAADVVGDKLIALTIFYSSCTTVCPVISAVFADVQDQLGERLGHDVALISLTVDPTTDTPRRLQAYAAKFDAKPGWQWLTGDKRSVDEVLNGLGLYTANYTEHPAAVLIGDGKNGNWSRFYGFPSAKQIVAELDRFELARGGHEGGSNHNAMGHDAMGHSRMNHPMDHGANLAKE